MNGIESPWLEAVREDGCQHRIAPWQIAEQDNPVVELMAPRPDFLGGNYQFLIGLLQTVFAPEDHDQWLEYWETPPDPEQLKKALKPFAPAFELVNPGGPAFLQDLDLPDGEVKKWEPISRLLIDFPGENTEKANRDLFVKRPEKGAGMCEDCTATALFVLQANAPDGGAGHRAGMRKGGPLTTILKPQNAGMTLWKKLWLNVMSREDTRFETAIPEDEKLFPWLASTRISDKTSNYTYPVEDHARLLQVYWSMPRRIRLQTENRKPGQCFVCGCNADQLISGFCTRKHGVKYEGDWVHPFSPYEPHNKPELPQRSILARKGGMGYQHWLGLTWEDGNTQVSRARVLKAFYNLDADGEIAEECDGVSLWCSGFNMKSANALCWYEHYLPVMSVPQLYQGDFINCVSQLIVAAREVADCLCKQVKASWFNPPATPKKKTPKYNMEVVEKTFWQATENEFYCQIHELFKQVDSIRHMPSAVAKQWLTTLRHHAQSLFDHWVLEGNVEELDLKRVINARNLLQGKLWNSKLMLKPLKDLDHHALQGQEAA